MARRRRSRQVDIFNFSFLDILACVIGLLIFIMVMVFVLQSAASNAAAANPRKAHDQRAQAAMWRRIAQRDNALASRMAGAAAGLQPAALPVNLALQLSAAQQAFAAAEARDAHERAKLLQLQAARSFARRAGRIAAAKAIATAEARLAAAQHKLRQIVARRKSLVRLLPVRRGAPNRAWSHVLYVDCGRKGVTMFRLLPNGHARKLGHTDNSDLNSSSSAYQKCMATQSQYSHGDVLFWVHPNAITTFNKAKAAKPAGVVYGDEPATARFSFATAVGQK